MGERVYGYYPGLCCYAYCIFICCYGGKCGGVKAFGGRERMESVKQPHKRVEKDGQWLSVAVEGICGAILNRHQRVKARG
jgi:hypothetical protein